MNITRQSDSSLSASSSSSDSSAASGICSSGPYAVVVESTASNFDLLSQSKSQNLSLGFPGRKRRCSTVKTLAIASLFVAIVCLVSLGALSFWLFVFNGRRSAEFRASKLGKEGEVCVPCLQVSPDPLDSSLGVSIWDQLTVRSDDRTDGAICCATTASQYAVLFKLILQRQQQVQKLAEYLEGANDTDLVEPRSNPQQMTYDRPVSAHLAFKPQSQRTTVMDPPVEQWKSPAESPLSHSLPGLRLDSTGTRMLVETPGLYYVYCQFLYNPSYSSSSQAPSDDHLQRIVSAYVRRYSLLHPEKPIYLLKSRHTRDVAREDRHSSYVGGVFRLYPGDSLTVLVSQPDLISYDDVASFFGLFRVGP